MKTISNENINNKYIFKLNTFAIIQSFAIITKLSK